MLRRIILMAASVLALTIAGIGQGAWADTSEQEAKTALAEFEKINPKVKSLIGAAHGYAVLDRKSVV